MIVGGGMGEVDYLGPFILLVDSVGDGHTLGSGGLGAM